jgi:hypothetical protein
MPSASKTYAHYVRCCAFDRTDAIPDRFFDARAMGNIMRMLGAQELLGPTGEWPPVGPAYR